MFANVAIPLPLTALTYSIPDHLVQSVRPGSCVEVEIRAKKICGVVLSIHKDAPADIKKVKAILGEGATVTVDPSTRTLVYRASQRRVEMAERYFQRMRSSTAMIVFETYIWEVSLDSGNSAGVKWNLLDSFGKFAANVDLSGSVGADFTNPISIGLPTTQGAEGGTFTPTKILDFLSTFGALKTIARPQITF